MPAYELIYKILLELDEIEHNFALLLTTKSKDTSSVDLLNLYTQNIKEGFDRFSSYICVMYDVSKDKNIEGLNCTSIVCNLISLLLTKLLLTVGSTTNEDELNRAVILKKLNHLDGILVRIKNTTELICQSKI